MSQLMTSNDPTSMGWNARICNNGVAASVAEGWGCFEWDPSCEVTPVCERLEAAAAAGTGRQATGRVGRVGHVISSVHPFFVRDLVDTKAFVQSMIAARQGVGGELIVLVRPAINYRTPSIIMHGGSPYVFQEQ